MKTILIIGDSWGVPNYQGPPGSPPETHTEYRLRELGYTVYNCAINGGSNGKSTNLASKFLSGDLTGLESTCLINKLWPEGIPSKMAREPEGFRALRDGQVRRPWPSGVDKDLKIDVIIWFHTEFMRGEYKFDFVNTSIEQNIIHGAQHDYTIVRDFLNERPHAKLVVIGGQSPVITDILYQYLTPDLVIQDWRSELLNMPLPTVHTLVKPELWVEPSRVDTMDYKLKVLEDHKIILDAMQNSDLFPDNCHPGGNAHEQLTTRLHKQFQSWFSVD
jgi:hypothetical protein